MISLPALLHLLPPCQNKRRVNYITAQDFNHDTNGTSYYCYFLLHPPSPSSTARCLSRRHHHHH
uniref:Uncharacterized protein n=1 Tax=Oryza brachyantha TaxID=4533 RepID=J3KVU5_ORYBR